QRKSNNPEKKDVPSSTAFFARFPSCDRDSHLDFRNRIACCRFSTCRDTVRESQELHIPIQNLPIARDRWEGNTIRAPDRIGDPHELEFGLQSSTRFHSSHSQSEWSLLPQNNQLCLMATPFSRVEKLQCTGDIENPSFEGSQSIVPSSRSDFL